MKKILSLVLAAVMVASMFAGLQISSSAETSRKASSLSRGDTFTMGRWPQSEVKDSSLLSSLNALSVKLYSYEYKYEVEDENIYNIVDMSFGDVAYGGEVYRKVVINQYIPSDTSDTTGAYQDNNGYTTGNAYWFRWDPVKWRVLAKENDGVYVLSDIILDSQPYNDIDKNITWEECTLRAWLSQNFYQSAFSANEKSKVLNYYHQNEDHPDYGTEGGVDTTDKVWLLSYSDAGNSSYGFSSHWDYDTARRAQGSDYAKSQGLWVSTDSSYYGYSCWWLRSPGNYSDLATHVSIDGYASDYYYVDCTYRGVRPAFKLNLSSSISSAEPAEVGRIFHGSTPSHTHSYTDVVTQPTCTEQGYTTHTCTCGDVITDTYVPALGHDFSDNAQVCRRGCGAKNPDYIPPVPAHKHAYKAVVIAPKANALGYTCYKCSCGQYQKNAKGIVKKAFKAPTGKPAGVRCAARTVSAEKFAWNKVTGATGYQAQLLNATGKAIKTVNTKSNAYTFSKLAAGTNYKVRVRFYIKAADGKNYFSKWSAILASPTLPKGTSVSKVTAAKKAFTAKWGKVAGVTGYQINYKYFDPQSLGGAPHCKTVTVKGAAKTSFTAKKLLAKTRYEVKVRTYKTIGGKTYVSNWSAVKAVKTK